MFTDPSHLRVEDPGKVEGNPVFIYLDAFCHARSTLPSSWPEYSGHGGAEGALPAAAVWATSR